MFAERLSAKRNEKGLTQGRLGQLAGVSQQYISHLEQGYKLPPGKLIARLADILECSADYLLGRAEDARENV